MKLCLLLAFAQICSITGDLPSVQDQSTSEDEEIVQLLSDLEPTGELKRRKREWLSPTLKVQENQKGPFPTQLEGAKITSNFGKETRMVYSITGEGANQPPVGLFTIDRNTGQLYVTKPLDREVKAKYEFIAHAVVAYDPAMKEPPMEITVTVIDMNDNRPIFTQNPSLGSVPEALPRDYEFMTVNATDADDPETDNADIRYSIISQNPPLPNPFMFTINSVTGGIRVNSEGLDRENHPEYTLLIQAADMVGNGLVSTGTAVITVTDSNDLAPQFKTSWYTASVPENKVGALVGKLPVTDGDEPQSAAWAAKFRIINGNNGGFFIINTGPNKQEGIITTVKPLDFEQNNKYTLLVVAENDVPFAKPLTTATATVIVNVQDTNEAPVFDPIEQTISKPEELEVGSELTVFTAIDPDTAKNQIVAYRVGVDPAGWLSVDRNSGRIKVRSPMDRESSFVEDGKYKALILAVDDYPVPDTGTGTLVIELQDVNDNAPVIEERKINLCNYDSAPVLLSVTDKDGPGFGAPYIVELQGDSHTYWTARMDKSRTGILLSLKTPLKMGAYNVVLRVYDSSALYQDNSISVYVRECPAEEYMYYFCLKI